MPIYWICLIHNQIEDKLDKVYFYNIDILVYTAPGRNLGFVCEQNYIWRPIFLGCDEKFSNHTIDDLRWALPQNQLEMLTILNSFRVDKSRIETLWNFLD